MVSRPSSDWRSPDEKPNPVAAFLNGIFLLAYFTLLPVILLVILSWIAYTLTSNNFFQDPWMMPGLLLFSTFLAGALMRQKMEDEDGGMVLFFLGIVGLLAFAWMTQHDIDTLGGMYSRFLPKLLRPGLEQYVYMLPGVGIVGMLFYKYFTIKHYN